MQSRFVSKLESAVGRDLGFRLVTMVVLGTGMYLHLTHIIVGREIFLERVLRPEFEWPLSAAMLYVAVIGVLLHRRAELPTLRHRIGYVVLLMYFMISVAIHAAAVATGSSDYVRSFPAWYSYPSLVVMVGLFLFARSLSFGVGRRRPVQSPSAAGAGS